MRIILSGYWKYTGIYIMENVLFDSKHLLFLLNMRSTLHKELKTTITLIILFKWAEVLLLLNYLVLVCMHFKKYLVFPSWKGKKSFWHLSWFKKCYYYSVYWLLCDSCSCFWKKKKKTTLLNSPALHTIPHFRTWHQSGLAPSPHAGHILLAAAADVSWCTELSAFLREIAPQQALRMDSVPFR